MQLELVARRARRARHRQRLDLPERQRRGPLDVELLVELAQLALGVRRARWSAAPRSSRPRRAARPGTRSAPSRWSQSPWVASRPTTAKPACSSDRRQDLELVREDRRVDAERLLAASARACRSSGTPARWRRGRPRAGATTRMRRGAATRAEQLGRFEEGLDLGRRLLLARLERLLVAVDPDHGDLRLQARLDVVVVARRDVDPALLGADAPLALLEVRGVGLVGAHLLGGDDEVEVVRKWRRVWPEQLVVDVRDQPGLELLGDVRAACWSP